MSKNDQSRGTSRRQFLKSATAMGVAASTGPWVIKDAFSSSGTVNVFAWGDYIQPNMVSAFEKKTGIKINLSTYGSNDEAEQKLRAAGGKGFDIVMPSVTNRANYDEGDLLQPIDESKVNIDAVIPSMYKDSIQLGAVKRGKRYVIPFNWGTEAITFDSSVHKLADSDVSYASLWEAGLDNKVAFRQKSALVGVAVLLDHTGEAPSNRGLDLYKSEEDMRRVMDASLAYILKHKNNFGAFWNNATEATNAFTQAGCTIGQTWDTTGIKLGQDIDPKWKYRMPKESGITWMDGMAIPSGAANIEQAYAFINAMLTPEIGAMLANNTGYNSAAQGAADMANTAYKYAYNAIYNEATLSNLWWWQSDTPYFAPVRQEYVDRITNA